MHLLSRSGMRLSGLVPLLSLFLILSLGTTPVGGDSLAWGSDQPQTIVLVTLDGARADLPLRVKEMPELAATARGGIILQNATTPTAMTFPATASLMTGLYPHHNGVRDEFRAPLEPGVVTIAGRLAAAGWRTAGFPGDYLCHARSGMTTGFDVYLLDSPELGDSARVDSVLAFLRDRPGGRCFAWVGFSFAIEHSLWERYLGSESPDSTAYLARARALDVQIGRLRAGLGTLGLESKSCFIVLGTHGEAVPGWPMPGDPARESSLPGHGLDLTEAAIRVPWVMRLPDGFGTLRPSAVADDGWISTIDLLPTILELSGTKAPDKTDGISLVPYLRGGRIPARVLYHEADLSRTLGWEPRYAARGSRTKLIDYGGRTAIRPVGVVHAQEIEGETSGLLAALSGEFSIPPTALHRPVTPDTLFGREDREIRLLLELRPTPTHRDPDAPGRLGELSRLYPKNILFLAESSLMQIYGRREQQAAGPIDALLDARKDVVEIEALYTEHLLFFNKGDLARSRLESLSGYPMFEADRIWRVGATQVLAGQYQDAARTYAQASRIGAPPARRWRAFQEQAALIEGLRLEIKAYPKRITAYLRLGETLWNLGLLDQGYAQFQLARGQAPMAAEPEYMLGHYLSLEGRRQHGVVALKRALEKNPKYLPARIELAYAQIQSGERDAALSNLQEAAAAGEVDAQVHYNIACLLAQKGERESALRELETAVGKGYSDRSLLERDPDLAPVRDDPRFASILASIR
jgi:tetratricopeptide (TPR) repeat protein